MKNFSVILEQIATALSSGIEEEFEKSFVEAMGDTEPPRQRPSRRPIDSFSFDSDWEHDDDLV